MADQTENASQALIVNTCALINEMIDCYEELADQLENCNNDDGAAMFHQLVRRQRYHLESLTALGPNTRNPPPTTEASLESPADHLYLQSHYLMTPYHVVKLALETEARIDGALKQLNGGTPPDQPTLMQQYVAERDRHRQSLSQLLDNLPAPDHHWDEDPDPPHLDQ